VAVADAAVVVEVTVDVVIAAVEVVVVFVTTVVLVVVVAAVVVEVAVEAQDANTSESAINPEHSNVRQLFFRSRFFTVIPFWYARWRAGCVFNIMRINIVNYLTKHRQ
jgi:hypothetical protein